MTTDGSQNLTISAGHRRQQCGIPSPCDVSGILVLCLRFIVRFAFTQTESSGSYKEVAPRSWQLLYKNWTTSWRYKSNVVLLLSSLSEHLDLLGRFGSFSKRPINDVTERVADGHLKTEWTSRNIRESVVEGEIGFRRYREEFGINRSQTPSTASSTAGNGYRRGYRLDPEGSLPVAWLYFWL